MDALKNRFKSEATAFKKQLDAEKRSQERMERQESKQSREAKKAKRAAL